MLSVGNRTGSARDLHCVNCEQAREATSARLDGELGPEETAALDAHMADCSSCTTWEHDTAAVTRRARLHPAAAPGPDLTARVLAAAASVRSPWPAERWLLLVVGATMLLAALPSVLGAGDVHLIRDAGITDVALAVGILSAAWQPWRAAGVLPVVLVLAAALTATAVADVARGDVPLMDEAAHTLAPTAALLLWRLRRRTPAEPTAPPAQRLTVVDDPQADGRKSA
jgi:predicted anti-sigma-YlaC factor YlaD